MRGCMWAMRQSDTGPFLHKTRTRNDIYWVSFCKRLETKTPLSRNKDREDDGVRQINPITQLIN